METPKNITVDNLSPIYNEQGILDTESARKIGGEFIEKKYPNIGYTQKVAFLELFTAGTRTVIIGSHGTLEETGQQIIQEKYPKMSDAEKKIALEVFLYGAAKYPPKPISINQNNPSKIGEPLE